MRIEDTLYQCLKNANYPVYKIQAPQNTPVPYAVFYVVSDEKVNCADGQDVSLESVRFTLDVYDATLVGVKDMSDEIQQKLRECETFSYFVYQTLDDMPDNINYRSIIDFKLNRQGI